MSMKTIDLGDIEVSEILSDGVNRTSITRLVKHKPDPECPYRDLDTGVAFSCPYGSVGDTLAVREAWRAKASGVGVEYRASARHCDPTGWNEPDSMALSDSRIALTITESKIVRLGRGLHPLGPWVWFVKFTVASAQFS